MAALCLTAPAIARWSPPPSPRRWQHPLCQDCARRRRGLARRRASGDDGPEEAEAPPVRTLLVDNYDSYTYNLFQELSVVNGVPPVVVRNDEWAWGDVYYWVYKKRAFDNIVISPGPGSPACPGDIGLCLRIVSECGDIPILGVCLGHQALGLVHGAKIVHAPEAIHGRLSEIEHNGSYLFNHIPSGINSGFKVVRYHSLVIEATSLPEDLVSIAWCASPKMLSFVDSDQGDNCPLLGSLNNFSITHPSEVTNNREVPITIHNPGKPDGYKIIMGIKHSSRPHYGVQFHPESIATRYGRHIFQNFKRITTEYGSPSSSFLERKAHSADQCNYVPKGLLHTERLELRDSVEARMLPERSSEKKYLRLRWKRIDNFLSRTGGSEDIFSLLFGHENADDTFWLDSSSVDQNRARFSFMGGKGGPLWKQMTFHLSNQSSEGNITIRRADGSAVKNTLKDGFLEFLHKEIQSIQNNEEDFQGLPFEFHGGFVGYLGYNLDSAEEEEAAYVMALGEATRRVLKEADREIWAGGLALGLTESADGEGANAPRPPPPASPVPEPLQSWTWTRTLCPPMWVGVANEEEWQHMYDTETRALATEREKAKCQMVAERQAEQQQMALAAYQQDFTLMEEPTLVVLTKEEDDGNA
ncbi:hypothetical protein VPH35_140808 [Triticum aestivum]